MKEKNICRCCKKKNLVLYLDLGMQPLANCYHKGERLPRFPLRVNVCENCFHSQLSVVVNKELMFKNYLYVSGTTSTFRKHTKDLAINAVRRFKREDLDVLDIACNDGTQLEYFRDLGCNVMGVDPAENLRSITINKKIDVVVDYWTRSVAKKISKKFDIITGTNVFAHVDNLDEFLKASKIALKKGGILILEFPYADKMIMHNEFDTVYHEHLSYYLVNSFRILIERMGFFIEDVMQTPIHGGSIRFFVKEGKKKHSKKINYLIDMEKKKGLFKTATYREFGIRVKKNKNEMKSLMKQIKEKGNRVVGYGASAKGNTMLNFFKISLDYIVDDNSFKWGFMTPGRNILIKNPEELAKEKRRLYIVVLSWNFYNEIAKKIRELRGRDTKDICIMYIPKIKQIPLRKSSSFLISA